MMYRMIYECIVCATILFIGNSDAAVTSSLPNTTTLAPEEKVSELHCYTCNGVGPTNPCLNYTNFEVAHAMWRSESVRDGPVKIETCQSPRNESCTILTYSNEKGEEFHSRSCSDDVTFGLKRKKWARYLPITIHVATNNITRCAWDDKSMICLTACIGDSKEPCNGPQLAGNFISASGFLLVLCACMQIVNSVFLHPW